MEEPPASPGYAPILSFRERDRRWAALRGLMDREAVDAIVVGSWRGRERHEAYIIDDEVDGCVVMTPDDDPTVLTWSTTFLSRTRQSVLRGANAWTDDYRLGRRPDDLAHVLEEKGLATSRVGVVGLSATSPGELDGTIPYRFWAAVLDLVPKADFVDVTLQYADVSLVRSEEELALLRYAAAVSEDAVRQMVRVSRPGVSESQIYAVIASEVYRSGCYLKYPYLSLHSGPTNLGWGPPRWSLRAESPRILQRGDMVQAEIHTCYGGMEGQVQASVALDPISADLRRCEGAAQEAYKAGVKCIRPGCTVGDLLRNMEAPLEDAGCWAETPLVHTLTFGATGFSSVNRTMLRGTPDAAYPTPESRRLDLELKPGMPLELEPNACIGSSRVNIGGVVVVTESACEPLNDLSTYVHHAG